MEESGVKNIDETLAEILQQFKNLDHKFTSLDAKYEQLAKEIHHKEVPSSSSSSSEILTTDESSIQATQVIQSSPNLESSSSSSKILCEICVEMKETDQMFKYESCVHSFCSDCVAKHVATKIQDNMLIVRCPGLDCKAVLELEACRPLLPQEVIERWEQALCEALVLGANKIYCPFKDCSTALVIDNEEGDEVNVRESECPVCHRLFCARCQVSWHSGVECEEFQKLNKDERGREDLMVKELAKEKRWKRCPRCKYYVEKSAGCLRIICRCKFQFCYRCGEKWTPTHYGCPARPAVTQREIETCWDVGICFGLILFVCFFILMVVLCCNESS